jgi:hypothetical protein
MISTFQTYFGGSTSWKDDRIMEMMFFVTTFTLFAGRMAIFFYVVVFGPRSADFVPQDHITEWTCVQAAAATWLSMQLGETLRIVCKLLLA